MISFFLHSSSFFFYFFVHESSIPYKVVVGLWGPDCLGHYCRAVIKTRGKAVLTHGFGVVSPGSLGCFWACDEACIPPGRGQMCQKLCSLHDQVAETGTEKSLE